LYDISQNNLTSGGFKKTNITKKWTQIYKASLLNKEQIDDSDFENIKTILGDKLNRLKESDIVKIKDALSKDWE
jgi:hypothetical protein